MQQNPDLKAEMCLDRAKEFGFGDSKFACVKHGRVFGNLVSGQHCFD